MDRTLDIFMHARKQFPFPIHYRRNWRWGTQSCNFDKTALSVEPGQLCWCRDYTYTMNWKGRQRQVMFLFSKMSRPNVGLVQYLPGVLSPGSKRTGRDVDHSSLFNSGKDWQKFADSLKYAFHCTDVHKTHTRWNALHGNLLYRVLSKSDDKYRRRGQNFVDDRLFCI
jgi:hypothetical protein